MTALIVHRAGPGVTIQDHGRPGHLAQGLSRGGALDRMALYEGAALLGQSADLAALEMIGMGGVFEPTAPIRIALTGAPMRANLDGAPLIWNANHAVPAGAKLEIGPVTQGSAGYLHIGGGIATELVLGARAVHLNAGLGAAVAAGDHLPIGADAGGPVGLVLDVEDRMSGGDLRLLPSVQTEMFGDPACTRLADTRFERDPRSNRMALRLASEGEGFALEGGLSVVSETIVPGDVQITGDGVPVILLAECQTTGGYPRIATVIAPDLPRAAQTPPGAALRFRFVSEEEARAAYRVEATDIAGLPKRIRPLVRDPRDIPDLLSYRLIDGATAGEENDT